MLLGVASGVPSSQVTKAANVWSFGVVMWEVASRGELPYAHLDHEQVIQEVIVDQTSQLDLPPNLHLHADKLYVIHSLLGDLVLPHNSPVLLTCIGSILMILVLLSSPQTYAGVGVKPCRQLNSLSYFFSWSFF